MFKIGRRLTRKKKGLESALKELDRIAKMLVRRDFELARVREERESKLEDLKQIQAGFKVEGKLVAVEEISYIDGASKKEIGLKIKNTGNSIVRTIFDYFKYEIESLDCVAIGHLTKKDIPRGHWKHLTEQEVNNLKML